MMFGLTNSPCSRWQLEQLIVRAGLLARSLLRRVNDSSVKFKGYFNPPVAV